MNQHPPVGQSELTATNAPVGRSVHWMGCVFSFDAGWGSWQSISFCCWPLYFIFLVLAHFSLDLTSHIATLLTFLPCSLFYLATVLTTYPTNLATVLTTYPTNLATILTTYPTNLTTVLTTYPTNLATLLITYPTNLIIRFKVETHKLIDKFFINV
jgi:hypothetical protein